MTAKTNQSQLIACRMDYESGNYKTVTELAEKYGLNRKSLFARIEREKWKEKRDELIRRTENKIVKTRESLVEEYLLSTFYRAKKYEKLIDSSINQFATDQNGTNIIDPSSLDALSRSESRIHELAKSGLRIPTISQTDVTSKGQSIGESLVSAITKLREAGKAVDITSEQVKALSDYDIEPRKI